jgi:hypothetical protein
MLMQGTIKRHECAQAKHQAVTHSLNRTQMTGQLHTTAALSMHQENAYIGKENPFPWHNRSLSVN